MLQSIRTGDIGGGIVRRAFRDGDRFRRANERLEREEIMRWPAANRNALIDKRFVEIYPLSAATPKDAKRIVLHRGGGVYDVIEGRVLNAKPLTKAEAQALAKQK